VLSEVERVCDRVAIIRSGRLVLVEEIAKLRSRRRRNVAMQVEGGLPILQSVAGVSDVEIRGQRVTCSVDGDIGPFLSAIGSTRVTDLTIEVPRLEEAFLDFYGDGSS